jgi:hypothetical protein
MTSSTNEEAIKYCKDNAYNDCINNIKSIPNTVRLEKITKRNATDKEKLLFISSIHKLLKQNEIKTNIVPNTTTKKLSNIEAKDISTKPQTRSNKEEPKISDKLINDINSLVSQFNQTYYPNPSGGKSKSKTKKKKNYKKKTKTRRKNKRKENKRRKTYKKKKIR